MKSSRKINELRAKRGIAAAAVIFAVVASLYLGGALRVLDNKLLDARFGLFHRLASQNLVIVAIDPDSLTRFGSWPWPRDYHATVIENLVKAGAEHIAFDVDFSSTSTKASDDHFAAALDSAQRRVTLAVLKQRRRASDSVVLTEPLPAFRDKADMASVSVRPDDDGVIRRINSREPWENGMIPSVPAHLAGMAPSKHPIPDTYYIDYGFDLTTIPQISYADVLANSFDSRTVAGKTVIVGATAVQLGDYLPVPRFGVLPGVQVLALAYESLVHNRALQRLDSVWILAGMLLIAFSLSPFFVRVNWRRGLMALAAATMGITMVTVLAFMAGIIVDSTPFLLTTGLCFVAGVISRSDWQALLLRIQGREIQHRETMMNGVVHTSFDAIFIMDDNGKIREANRAAIAMFGHDEFGLRGRSIVTLIASAKNLLPRESMQFAPVPDAGRSEMIARRLDGTEFPVEIMIRQMVTETSCHQIAFVRDITERKAHQRELEHLASHDSLTELPNRGHFLRTLREAIRSAEHSGGPFALLLLDLNRFKEINDTLGHHVGDNLLREIAGRLKKPLRRTDMIARLGGDEFAILLNPAPDRALVSAIAKGLQDAFDTPLHYEDMDLDLGASIGAAFFPEDSVKAEELVQKADVAMYSAKRASEPMAFYDRAMDRHYVRHLTMTGDLKRAIENGDLALHYQPKIDIERGVVIGVESLLRWKHPLYGFVPPDEFVRIAENTGLIHKLTDWVLEAAFAQCARWHAAGNKLNVAINLSARSLHDNELSSRINALLEKYEIAPEFIVLEITEGAIMADPERARAIIGRLHDRGLKLSIDDFGTGYSSLGYLKKLPVNELKIDKSFVFEMTTNEGDRVIVKSTIDLAHNLGLSVVAEGVENAETLGALRALRADVAQGYFMSKPLPAADFNEWLLGWQSAHPQPKLRLVAQA